MNNFNIGGGHFNDGPREMHKATCSSCGKECEVPFRPSADRPVYCKVCYSARKNKTISTPKLESKPKEAVPVQPLHTEKPPVVKPAAHKGKKKPAKKIKKK